MQDWTDIRRQVLVEGASQRSVCRQYGIAHKTLQKILAHSEPPGYRQQLPRPKTKLGPYLATIEEILAADRGAPAKQRHTGKRIFERLRDEHGYAGGITQVRLTVARLRRRAAEGYAPLAHRPGGVAAQPGHGQPHLGDAARVAVLVAQALEDALAGVALLGRRPAIGGEDLLDGGEVRSQLGLGPRQLLAVAGRLAVGEDLLQRLVGDAVLPADRAL